MKPISYNSIIDFLSTISEFKFLGQNADNLLYGILVFIFSLVSLKYTKQLLHKKLKGHHSTSKLQYLVEPGILVLTNFTSLLLVTISIYLGSTFLVFGKKSHQTFLTFLTIVFFYQLGIWLDELGQYALKKRFASHNSEDNTYATSSFWLISFFIKVLSWLLIVLVLLDNIGINVTALVAGLGIGGIAIALAVQNILSDLLCSLSIVLDKPFEIGDSIVVGKISGKVEKIGVKSTRIRSINGEQIVIANSDLIKSQISNFKSLEERRAVISLSLDYINENEILKIIPNILKEIINSHQTVRFDRAHLINLAEASLQYEAVYFVQSSDYPHFMDIQQAINFEILDAFKKQDIKLFHTQTK